MVQIRERTLGVNRGKNTSSLTTQVKLIRNTPLLLNQFDQCHQR
jgi:hypothetical protein